VGPTRQNPKRRAATIHSVSAGKEKASPPRKGDRTPADQTPVDAPIAVKKSSGGEPLAVVGSEGVIALASAFEP
jgi:hypothetical protein